MIPELRRQFNSSFTPQKYRDFLERLDRRCGTHVAFRNCETPCFFPVAILDRMVRYGREMVEDLLANPDYMAASSAAIPAAFHVPNESPHPLFVQADFGLARDSSGNLEPRLVEIQGFPSLYAFQPALAEQYRESFGLPPDLNHLLSRLDTAAYNHLLRRAVVGNCDPENVVLMEIDPLHQKTLCDFVLTERLLGIRTVALTDIVKKGNRLYYGPNETPIRRIYNRVIADELIRRNIRPAFDLRDDLDVEWAGHPNWFFRLSKFSIPWIRHSCVPKSWFLNQLPEIPDDPGNHVLKPLYSFAGLGVIVGPSREQIAAVPRESRANYILQERIHFEPVIETPFGGTRAEIRIMYTWLEELTAVTTIIRMGRGKMMGVDFNRDLEWVGASASFSPRQTSP